MKALGWILVLVLLAVVFGFMGHALWQIGDLRALTGGSWVLALVMAAGVLLTGLVAGGLMWLAFWSSRKGYDEAVQYDLHPDRPAADGEQGDR